MMFKLQKEMICCLPDTFVYTVTVSESFDLKEI